MTRLFDAYRAFHEQGFVPIFTEDGFDSKKLVAACVAAGMKGIEYTMRKSDVREMIPWIRKTYPDLFVLVGSTLDDEGIVKKMRRKNPQLLTLDEIAALDVHGFVSMIGWSLPSIRKFAPTHIIAPTASTVTEAFQQVGAGAHFAKLNGQDLGFVKRCRGEAAYDYCPIMVTGGMTTERIPEAINAGAVLVGAGFDMTLKGQPKDLSEKQITDVMRRYLDAMRAAREKAWPQLAAAMGKDQQTWLDALPHYHPF
jgi:2-keto-3-deoxy-6-phosphogluconate aldolase